MRTHILQTVNLLFVLPELLNPEDVEFVPVDVRQEPVRLSERRALGCAPAVSHQINTITCAQRTQTRHRRLAAKTDWEIVYCYVGIFKGGIQQNVSGTRWTVTSTSVKVWPQKALMSSCGSSTKHHIGAKKSRLFKTLHLSKDGFLFLLSANLSEHTDTWPFRAFWTCYLTLSPWCSSRSSLRRQM